MDKKGQELSVGTLILIVLGIVLLVLLILGFSLGWSNLWEKINIFGSGTSLESVAQKCSLAAASNSVVGYCETFSLVTVDGKKQYINCEYDKLNLEKKLTCNSAPTRQESKCIELLKEKFDGEFKVDEIDKFNTKCKESKDLVVNNNVCADLCDTLKFEFKSVKKKI